MRAVSQHINTISYLEEKTFAAVVVDNQMANVMLANTTPQAREGRSNWQDAPGTGKSRQ